MVSQPGTKYLVAVGKTSLCKGKLGIGNVRTEVYPVRYVLRFTRVKYPGTYPYQTLRYAGYGPRYLT